MTATRVAVLTAPQTFQVAPGRVRSPEAGQALVRLEGCGVCASNIPPFEGRDWFRYPFDAGSPGHEGWGVVEAVGPDVKQLKVGQRVASLGQRAYASHEVVDATELIPLPEKLADVPFPGEPLGCAMNIFRRSDVREGQWITIVGLGFLGCLLTGLCTSVGARVVAVSRRAYSLEMARRFGAVETISLGEPWDVAERISALTDGQMCDRAIECAGKQSALDVASEVIKTRGMLVVAGFHQDGPRQVNMQSWNWRGIDVINAHERDPEVYRDGVRAAISAVVEGRIDPTPLYTHRFGLSEIEEALRTTRERPDGFMKALIIND